MWAWYILLGLIAGISSGFLGIGGGTIIIPALVYFFGLNQHTAQGTSLAIMIPPIGLLAAWEYWRKGHVALGMALFICVGFFVGGLIGAYLAHRLSPAYLKRVFGLFLILVGTRMALGK